MREFIRHYASEVTPLRLALFTVIGVAAALFLITVPPTYILLAMVGVVVLAVVAARPEVGVLLIVVLTSSIVFEESLPLIPIGVGSLHLSDVLLLFMLGVLVYRYVADRDFRFAESPLNKPLLLFFAVALASAAVSITRHGVDFNDVARLVRVVSYYLLFFLVTNLVTEAARLKFLIMGLFTLAVVVAAAMVAQAVIGESVQLMPGRIESAASLGRVFGALRILPPGQTLVFVMFLASISMLAFSEDKPVLFSAPFLLVLVLGAGVMLTFNRSYWVAVILGLALLFMMTAAETRMRLATLLLTLLILGGSVTLLAGGSGGRLGATVDAVSERFGSIFAGKELRQSSSLDDRRIENEYAVARIKSHPILGIGLGNDYRPGFYQDDKLTYYLHNAYLWLLTDMGIIGFLSFFWFYLRFLAGAARNWKRIRERFLKSVVAGFMISGVAILAIAFVIPIFMEWFSVVIMATMIGLTDSLIRNMEMEGEETDAIP